MGLLGFIANLLIVTSLILLTLIFWPVAKEEVRYSLNRVVTASVSKPKDLMPPNTDFSIVIPKIFAVSSIVPNVDSQNSSVFLPALKKGVAHALGTSFPGEAGNTFLFAHSTDTFYNLVRYNAVFYLIGKLQPGDEVDIYYRGNLIKYRVYDKKVVNADSSQYFGTILPDEKTLTLQTCYPPGTTLKRLVILAKQITH